MQMELSLSLNLQSLPQLNFCEAEKKDEHNKRLLEHRISCGNIQINWFC